MTTLTAVLALIVSVVNYIQLNERPTIQMAMPKVIRIAQGPYTDLYIRPTFTVQKKTDVAAVISDVSVELQGPGAMKPQFYWRRINDTTQDPNGLYVKLIYVGDPVPITVTQEKPLQYMFQFSSIDPAFMAGTWTGSFTAEFERQPSIVSHFCIDIAPTDMQIIDGAHGNNYYLFRNDNDQQNIQDSTSASHCYRWSTWGE